MVEYSDLIINVDRLKIDISKGSLKPQKFDKLQPRLYTVMAKNRRISQRETVLGMAKRNVFKLIFNDY